MAKQLKTFNLLPREFTVKKTSVGIIKWVVVLAFCGAFYGFTVLKDLDTKIVAKNQELQKVKREQTSTRTWSMNTSPEVLKTVCDSLSGEWDGVETNPPSLGRCTRSFSYQKDATLFDTEMDSYNTMRPKVYAVTLLGATQFPWEVLLDEIRTLIPKNVWLSQRAGNGNNPVGIVVEDMTNVSIFGQSITEEDIYKFAKAIQASKFFNRGSLKFSWSYAVDVDPNAVVQQQAGSAGGALQQLTAFFEAKPDVTFLYNFEMQFDISAELLDSQAIQAQLEASMGRGDASSATTPPPTSGGMAGGMGVGGVGGGR